MRFFSANKFLVLILLAVVVVGGGLLIANSKASSKVEAQIKEMESISSRLLSAFRRQIVNEAVVQAEEQRVESIRQQAAEVEEDQVRKNKLAYPVLELPIYEQGVIARHVQAFPVDRQMDRMYGLNSAYQTAHREKTRQMIASLSPTSKATEEEIQQEAKAQEVMLMMHQPVQRDEEPAGMMSPDGQPPMPTPYAPSNRSSRRTTTDSSITNMALGQAHDVMLHRKAERGRVYVDSDAILAEISYPRNEAVDPPWTSLWIKQYKLWIASDVADAIAATNEDILSTLSEGKRNVINAPVKHWLSISIADNYFFGGSTSSSSSRSQSTGGGYAPMPGGMPNIDHEYYGMSGPMGGQIQTPVPGDMTRTYDVTGRITDTNQDVIRYEFTVVMPTRHVHKLMSRLMDNENGEGEDATRRYHTVLDTRIDRIGDELSGYYYGNDPVVVATFSCQFMMLPVWSRPLAPREFVASLHPDALRQADRERIQGR